MTEKHDAPEGGAEWDLVPVEPAHPCQNGCQYAKDISMWPEYSCAECRYDLLWPNTPLGQPFTPPAPSGLVDAAQALIATIRNAPTTQHGNSTSRVIGCFTWLDLVNAADALDATLSGQQGGAVPAGDADRASFVQHHAPDGSWQCQSTETGRVVETKRDGPFVGIPFYRRRGVLAPTPPAPSGLVDAAKVRASSDDMDGLTLAQRLDKEEAEFTTAVENAYDENGPGVMPGDVEGMFHRTRSAAGLAATPDLNERVDGDENACD